MWRPWAFFQAPGRDFGGGSWGSSQKSEMPENGSVRSSSEMNVCVVLEQPKGPSSGEEEEESPQSFLLCPMGV